jgi:1,4-dihydroxy-6-naphthoate synthase
MWWPATGKVAARPPHETLMAAALATGRFRYRAVPRDIESLNRIAAGAMAPIPSHAAEPLDITALSARAYADAAERYIITSCGASFGDGYGPKVVCRAGEAIDGVEQLRRRLARIAVPGARTTAFLVLSLLMGRPFEFVEMPFDRIIGAVSDGGVIAGLIIHEGQLTFADAGLREVADVGAWWKATTGLPLPLGVNAVRRDLDERFGAGSLAEIGATLRESVRYAMDHREESLEYAMGFAMANRGGEAISRARVERFVDMYVNRWTLDMGDAGREAIRRLLDEGADAGLCPRVGEVAVL